MNGLCDISINMYVYNHKNILQIDRKEDAQQTCRSTALLFITSMATSGWGTVTAGTPGYRR